MTISEIAAILADHKKWLSGDKDGKRADLRNANLGGANLGGANLGGANLHGTDLGGANLGGANLHGTDLGGADLRNANLHGTDLGGANLDNANLRNADLDNANLRNADLGGANLGGADLGETCIWQFGPLGSRRAYLTVKQGPGLDEFHTGCFSGTMSEFEAAVQQTHGDNQFGRQYRGIIALVKEWIKEPV